MNNKKQLTVRKARVCFNDEKDVLLLRTVINYDPWRKGDKQWAKVVDEIQNKFEEEVTVRTVRSRMKTLIKNFNANELEYKSGVAEVPDSELNNLLQIIIAIEEEEKAAMSNLRAAGKCVPKNTAQVAGHLPEKVAENVPKEVQGNVLKEVAGNVPVELTSETARVSVRATIDGAGDTIDYDESSRLSAAKQRKLERDEADLERQRYLDEASGPSTSRKNRQRITTEEELINQRLELDIKIEKQKLKLQQEEFEAEKIRVMKREEHKMQIEKSKLEMDKQNAEEKLRLEKERLALENLREARKERETERRDEISKMSIEVQSKMMDMLAKFLEK